MKTLYLLLSALVMTACGTPEENSVEKNNQNANEYVATWNSLAKHETPKWLTDAKFGIYTHWGISTVDYSRNQKDIARPETKDEEISAMKNSLEDFKAEKFNPKAWAKLFKEAGAKFAGPTSWHGSPYIHWDSDLTPYNSVDMNPHRDIVGELQEAIYAEGMKFLMTLHATQHEDWLNICMDGINKYVPDLLWVDASFGETKGWRFINRTHFVGEAEMPEEPRALSDADQRTFIANYYNQALKKGKEVEFTYKSSDIPPCVGMRDLENGLMDQLYDTPWLTDVDMNICPDWATHGWFYREGIPLRDANNIIDMLADVVSKNGILLLNVPPKADGSFPVEVEETLHKVGAWLNINGEAIYNTTPWSLFGEGPTVINSNNNKFHHNDHFAQNKFTQKDIRFTVNGNNIYAICLGTPNDDQLCIKAMSSVLSLRKGDIENVSILGFPSFETKWCHDEQGLTVSLPDFENKQFAVVIKVTLSK